MDKHEKRAYLRGQHLDIKVTVSLDGSQWHHARVPDVSSGGLLLVSTVDYQEGQFLWFDLVYSSFMTQFDIKVEGKIVRKTPAGDEFRYGIQFINLSQDNKIRIDENIRKDRPVSGQDYWND